MSLIISSIINVPYWKMCAVLMDSSYNVKVNIRGPKDDVDKAKKLLVNLSNEKQLNSLTAEVRAKPEHHKFLIGRQGKLQYPIFFWLIDYKSYIIYVD